MFSTTVDLLYTYAPFEISAPKDEKKLSFDGEQIKGAGGFGAWEGVKVCESAREITLAVFATDDSASVQVRIGGGTDPKLIIKKLNKKHRRLCTRWDRD